MPGGSRKNLKKTKRVRQTASQKSRAKRAAHKGGVLLDTQNVHPMISSKWDVKKTMHQNYSALGLIDNVNAAVPKTIEATDDDAIEQMLKDQKAASAAAGAERGALADELEEMQNMPKRPRYIPRSMDVKEQAIIRELIAKHGTNYKKMAMDVDINVYQKTANDLEKRVAIFNMLQQL